MPPRINIRRNVPLAAHVEIIRPPLHHLHTRFQMLRLMHICRPHTVALLVAHLALDGVLRPQCGLVQGATGHRAEAMAAHLGFGVITDNTQRLVDGVFAHWLVHGVRPRKDENRFSGNFLYLLQQGDTARSFSPALPCGKWVVLVCVC